MNGAHIHLVVNHLPIVGIIISSLVLIAGYLLKKNQVKQTALGINIFAAIAAIVASKSGEEAEEILEEIQGISHKLIHIHEELAETFVVLAIVLGVISIVTLILSIKKSKFAKFGFIITLLLSLMLVYFGKETGTSGGEIRHSEIRTNQFISLDDDVSEVQDD